MLVALLAATSMLNLSLDVSEDRRNSFNPADEAALARMDRGLAISLYLAPEDSRAQEYQRNVLAKLKRLVPGLTVRWMETGKAGVFGAAGDEGRGGRDAQDITGADPAGRGRRGAAGLAAALSRGVGGVGVAVFVEVLPAPAGRPDGEEGAEGDLGEDDVEGDRAEEDQAHRLFGVAQVDDGLARTLALAGQRAALEAEALALADEAAGDEQAEADGAGRFSAPASMRS